MEEGLKSEALDGAVLSPMGQAVDTIGESFKGIEKCLPQLPMRAVDE